MASLVSEVEPGEMRASESRPVHKLTITLIHTYKVINKLYYENKTKQRESSVGKPCDDEFSDYIIKPGEEIIGRYIVQERIGKGSFGQVVRAFDKVTSTEVALKMIKSKKLFKNQANTEIDILVELRDLDVKDENHIVRLLNHFEHRNHPCLVFELLSSNLYDLLKNTKFRGISLDLIHKFARQILEALVFMRKQSVIHCDLKPENILLCQRKRSAIKIIDFGSSCKVDKKMFSYIQSRFYRAPEVIVGVPYSFGIDIWSLACILVEMHTGEPLFGGFDSQDQLFKIVHVLGDLPDHLVMRGSKRDKYYVKSKTASSSDYRTEEISSGMKQRYELALPSQYLPQEEGGFLDYPKPLSLGDIIGVKEGGPKGRRNGEKGHSLEHYELFLDFITPMLKMDPKDRVDPHLALQHPFLKAFDQSASSTSPSTSHEGSSHRRYQRKSSRRQVHESVDIAHAPSEQAAPISAISAASLEMSSKILSDLTIG